MLFHMSDRHILTWHYMLLMRFIMWRLHRRFKHILHLMQYHQLFTCPLRLLMPRIMPNQLYRSQWNLQAMHIPLFHLFSHLEELFLMHFKLFLL